MGIYVQSWDIVRKTKERNKELENVIEASRQSVLAMRQCSSAILKGKAWDSVRDYIRDVQAPLAGLYCLCAEAQIEANSRYAREADALPWDSIDEEELQKSLRDFISMLNHERNKPKEKQSQTNIGHYSAEIARYEGYIALLHLFEEKTASIYEEVKQYQAQIGKANTELAKVVFNADKESINYKNINMQWRTVVDDRMKASLEIRGVYKEEWSAALISGISLEEQLWILDEMKAEGAYTLEKYGGGIKIKFYDMGDLDYKYEDIICMWSTLIETEKPFMANIIKGTEETYKEAFLTDPNDLTDNMTLILSEYSYRLVKYATEPFVDKSEKVVIKPKIFLEKLGYFINGILASEHAYDEYDAYGMLHDTDYLYRDVYLERLAGGTEILAESSAILLACQKKEGIRDNDLWNKYEIQFGTSSAWYSLIDLINRKSEGWGDNYGFSVKGVNRYNDGTEVQIGYILEYYEPPNISKKSEEWRAGKAENTEISTIEYLASRERLEQQREMLWGQLVLGVGHTIASALCPELGLVTGIIQMSSSSSVPTVNIAGALNNAGIEHYGLNADTAFQSVAYIANMLISDVNMQNQIGVLDNQEKQKWFGVMGEYGEVNTMDEMVYSKGIFSGCSDPEGLYYIMMIEEKDKGLKKALQGTDIKIDSITNTLNRNYDLNSSDQGLADLYNIWNGGFSFAEEDSMERFARATQRLNGNYKEQLEHKTIQEYLMSRGNTYWRE